MEVELKYRVNDPATGERLLAADQLGGLQAIGGRARSTQLEDRYVDTRDGALAKAGFAVRLRQSGDDTIVTVKSLAFTEGDGGSVSRDELEGPADRVAPPAEWEASDARAFVLEHAGDAPLVERVTIRQLRHRRMLRSGESTVELSLDEVDVVSRGRIVRSFTELEAELVKGDSSLLSDLARRLDTESGLARSDHSKLEAALAAIEGSNGSAVGSATGQTKPRRNRPKPAADDAGSDSRNGEAGGAPGEAGGAPGEAGGAPGEAEGGHGEPEAPRLIVGKSPGVVAEDHIAEAGRKVMRFHLARMIEREPGVRSGKDIEDVHKMRVATRRQRAAWRVFGEAFRKKRTKAYRNGLRDIARRLGTVRDLDVQLEGVDAYRADLPVAEQRAIEPLLADWRQHRDDARVLLMRELDSPGYGRLIDDYLDFVRTEGAAVSPVSAASPHRVRDTAPSRIWASYEQVRAYEPVLRWADTPTLHELRIASKWLRYSLEFVQETLGDESAPLIQKVTNLQDHLGLMNDADVSGSMARTFLVEHAGQLSTLESAAIGRFLVNREREVARLRRTIGAPWRAVAGASFRRSLGRVVAGL
jgi:CHAD domain-containing protein